MFFSFLPFRKYNHCDGGKFLIEGARNKPDLEQTRVAAEKALAGIEKILGVIPEHPTIWLYYRRKDFDKATKWPRQGRSPAWMAGQANFKENIARIFAPSIYDKETRHEKKEYPQTLCHELTHLAESALSKGTWPKWLGEGLSYFVAEQIDSKRPLYIEAQGICQSLDTPTNWERNSNYNLASAFVKFLIEEFGLERFLTLCKSQEKNYKFTHFSQTFTQVLGKSVGEVEEMFLLRINKIS